MGTSSWSFDSGRLGAVDYITKPINPELVRLRVSNHLELKYRTYALEKRTQKLENSLNRIKRLEDIILICMYCSNGQESWKQLESNVL